MCAKPVPSDVSGLGWPMLPLRAVRSRWAAAVALLVAACRAPGTERRAELPVHSKGDRQVPAAAPSAPVMPLSPPDRSPVTRPPQRSPAASVPELRLVRALPIDRWDSFQPSGLLWHSGRLLTVSDKHDRQVFELLIEKTVARVREYQSFRLPPGVDDLDLEGLSSDGNDGLLLACESKIRVLRVGPDSIATWFTPSLEAVGNAVGLFQLRNATLEGLARLPDGRLLLAAERSQRGLIELPADGDLARAKAWSMPQSAFSLPPGRLPDWSDLAIDQGQVFALLRNGHLVVQLRREASGWREARAWSFAKTENDDRYAYRNRKYGVAEGLALDGNYIYITLDNNNDGRAIDPSDVRPLLLIFERPTS